MKKVFINNILFRLIAPILYGTLVYIFVLMIFDSIDQLISNFFSREVLVTVGISYLLSEGMRIIILVLNRYYPFERNINIRILIQLVLNSVYSVIIVGLVISIYFIKIIGSSVFSTELISFWIIFLISALLYNMLYLSIYYLQEHNKILISKEKLLKSNMEYNMRKFRNQINSDFLFESLETLISLINTETENSEKFLNSLSEVYRYKLDNQHEELINLEDELDIISKYIFLVNTRYDGKIDVLFDIPDNALKLKLIPGTLQIILNEIITQNVISSTQPLKVNIGFEKKQLRIKYTRNKRLYYNEIRW